MSFNRSLIKHFLMFAAIATGLSSCSDSDNNGPSPICNVTINETVPDGYSITSETVNFSRGGAVTTVTDAKKVELIAGTYDIEGTASATGTENGATVEKTLRAVAQNVEISESKNEVSLSWFVFDGNIDEPETKYEDTGYYLKTDIRDLVLIYQGGTHRMDFNAEQIRPYVVHVDRHGKRDWLFDGFLYLEFTSGNGGPSFEGNGQNASKKEDWLWLIDRHFTQGMGIPALDGVIEEEKAKIGEPSFKHKVVISMPEPQLGQKDWGELDGKKLDFSVTADRVAACNWYIDKLQERFEAAHFKNIELAGFYWMPEKSIKSREVTKAVGEHIHAMGKLFYWIPYFASFGYSEWKTIGFDCVYLQPSYFWTDRGYVPDNRLDHACELAYNMHMGLEMEFDMRASTDYTGVSCRDRGMKYMQAFRNNRVYREGSIAYYEGGSGIYSFSKKTSEKDKEFIDTLAYFVQERRRRMVEGKNPDFVTDFNETPLDAALWNKSGTVNCEGGTVVMSGNSKLDMRNKRNFNYGITKARVKILNNARDIKIYVRLLPTNEKLGALPRSGEMFLLRYDGQKANTLSCGTQTMQNNYDQDNLRSSSIVDEKAIGRWIDLECRWTDKELTFLIDGKVYNYQEDLYDSTKPYYPQGWPFNYDTFYLQFETESVLRNPVLEIDNVSILPY